METITCPGGADVALPEISGWDEGPHPKSFLALRTMPLTCWPGLRFLTTSDSVEPSSNLLFGFWPSTCRRCGHITAHVCAMRDSIVLVGVGDAGGFDSERRECKVGGNDGRE